MSTHEATIKWVSDDQPFTYESYSRNHTVTFSNGVELQASAAADYQGDPTRVDPEAMFVGSLANCHMLTFLAIAAKKRLTVTQYTDHASGELGKNEAGSMAMTRVTLRPSVQFASDKQPDTDALTAMHEAAHKHCFIANSVTAEIAIEPSE